MLGCLGLVGDDEKCIRKSCRFVDCPADSAGKRANLAAMRQAECIRIYRNCLAFRSIARIHAANEYPNIKTKVVAVAIPEIVLSKGMQRRTSELPTPTFPADKIWRPGWADLAAFSPFDVHFGKVTHFR
jgi:hypothetical protein